MTIAIKELLSIPLLADLDSACLECLSDQMIKRVYAPGEFIFLEGEGAAGIWFILSGQVKIIKFSTNGRIQALCLAKAGRCFGTCPLFNGSANPASAQAATEVALAVLPREDLNRLLRENICMGWALLQIYSQYLGQLARLSESLGVWTVSARINDCLLNHADYSDPYPIVPLTHEKLAELAGTVREVVSRHLANLAEQNVIRVEFGRIILLDATGLQLSCVSGKSV